MKLKSAILVIAMMGMFSSCGQIQRVMDGTEHLPAKIEQSNLKSGQIHEAVIESTKKAEEIHQAVLDSNETAKKIAESVQQSNETAKIIAEGIRKQKIAEALKIMLDDNNRKILSPIPSNMMSAGKAMAEALTSDEVLLFVRNYLVKINNITFSLIYPDVDENSEAGKELLKNFQINKLGDLKMIILVSSFLPDATLAELVAKESEQGAYRNILFSILKLRSQFYKVVMLNLGMGMSDDDLLESNTINKSLITLGQISKAIEYADKLDYICHLDFADKIESEITGLNPDLNEYYSGVLDPKLALNMWQIILRHAKADFKPEDFTKDPTKIKKYKAEHQKLIDIINKKISAFPKLP